MSTGNLGLSIMPKMQPTLARDDFRDKLAVAIANGILKAFGMGTVSHQGAGRPVDAGIAGT
ncbi:hypothetical protein P7H19_21535 [Paenibacillus larvae]|nr:hypothetical protein [Paenibacillus larvae]MDT2238337.1 hypothetical protein [Paenibacillus larvae]